MHYGKIIYYDTANARGLSTVLFVSGCDNHCEGCHNQQTWDFNYGKEYTEETENKILNSLKSPYVENLVITGGEPFHKDNIETVLNLCKKVNSFYNAFSHNKNIIIYTGYKIRAYSVMCGDMVYVDRINDSFRLEKAPFDYIIDGKYDKNLKTNSIDYRGSTNQRCYQINEFQINKFQKYLYCRDVTNQYFKEELNKF